MEMPTNKKFLNLTGHTYGRLTVLSYADKKGTKHRWNCQCECGGVAITASSNLRTGHTKSCGCAVKEVMTTHGMYDSPEYKAYMGMKERCCSKGSQRYASYGGRGISICGRWLESFDKFFADMGERPTSDHSIDRINNDGNYMPNNCKWSTRSEQARNKRILKANKSGVTGVFWIKSNQKWLASISIKGKSKYLGTFTRKADAIESRKRGESKYYAPLD